MSLKKLIKGNRCFFLSYRAGFLYYKILDFNNLVDGVPTIYQFTIPIDDVGNGTLNDTEKAITLMRWIRKAIENNELIKIN